MLIPAPKRLCAVFAVAAASFLFAPSAGAYSVLTHQAIIDTLWQDAIQPLLLQRFPNATPEELRMAHGYTYGGCIIQDLGFYPFGNRFFSDLTHYVRSADFVQSLLDEAKDVNEYAFALGALAHFGADVDGHSIAVNRAVPLLYPKLRRKFGNEVTYGDDSVSHLKTEFGFDVLQVARGHYAPEAYHDFVGFQVSKDLLDRAFQKTYGLSLKDIFRTLDLALGSYRYSVRSLLPTVTKAAWQIKKDEILQLQPKIVRREFLFNIKRSSFEKEWGKEYEHPGIGAQVLAFFFRLLPKFGPFKGLAFKVPTPETEKLFEESFNASVRRDRESFDRAKAKDLNIINRDLDTGKAVRPGEYMLADRTYDTLLKKLADKHFDRVTPDLRDDIVGFYGRMKMPDSHGITVQLEELKTAPLTAR